jgi:hypothetical protein
MVSGHIASPFHMLMAVTAGRGRRLFSLDNFVKLEISLDQGTRLRDDLDWPRPCGFTLTSEDSTVKKRTLFFATFVIGLSVRGLQFAPQVQGDDERAASVPLLSAVEGQPLGANAQRLLETLEFLGAPLPVEVTRAVHDAARSRNAEEVQRQLDPHVLFVVSLNPEVRVKVARGPGDATLRQAGYTPVLVKIINQSTVTRQLRIRSPQAGPVYSGAALSILQRQQQTELKDGENTSGATDRFLDVEMFQAPPMTRQLSGLEVEYAIGLIYCSEAGKREATIGFDVGAGTQDIGFRGEVPVLFNVRPARPVRLHIVDADGQPTTARIEVRDQQGHVFPPQVKRLAPDFFFQPQIYRSDGDTVLLPPGQFLLRYSRGPEYVVQEQRVTVGDGPSPTDVTLRLQRWIDPGKFGFYSGDHHIHGAGCSHYANPTQGVTPQDMFRQVKGEGLNVGCVLTWGPCFDFQRRYFSPRADQVSEPRTILKYDLEISGFGSAALGHVCLLNLKDQTYPGSLGTKDKGWPTWTVPVMRWAKKQGGVTGYPHSALLVNAQAAAERLIRQHDANGDGNLQAKETSDALLTGPFADMDDDEDGALSRGELARHIEAAAHQLPNLAVPQMNGPGALEICVAVAEGVCDFISAMDTERVSEWNTWYHLLNCGFPLKVSGETDFPCMSSRRVGQGRVYVQLGELDQVDFTQWCQGIARGNSYVSDGFAHAIGFEVDGQSLSEPLVKLATPGQVSVAARVAFAPRMPRTVAQGAVTPLGGRRVVGDTRLLHAPRTEEMVEGGVRVVEVVRNGDVVARRSVPADGQIHEICLEVAVDRSSWIALRQFPQLHTNPVNVLVAGQPIRASADSARWCARTVRQLWEDRHRFISEPERKAAHEAYQRAIATYERIAAEAG